MSNWRRIFWDFLYSIVSFFVTTSWTIYFAESFITTYLAVLIIFAARKTYFNRNGLICCRTELASKPFAAFLVCMTLAMHNGESYRPFVADFMAPVRALVKPVSEGLFAGTLDISKVPTSRNRLMFRLSVLFGVWSEGDHRDWTTIRVWAESLSPKLL